MKFFYFLLLSLIFISFKNYSSKYQIECFSIDSYGYVTLKIWNPQKYSSYKLVDAQKDAIDAVLFSGFSGTNGCQAQPPLLNDSEERNKFNKIKKRFFSNKGEWAIFVRSNTSNNIITLPQKKELKTYLISVSKNELRKYLTKQKILKPLNNGF